MRALVQPPGFQQPQYAPRQQLQPQQANEKSELEELKLMCKSQVVSIKTLENQFGQITNALLNRQPGTLPSDIEVPGKREAKEQEVEVKPRKTIIKNTPPEGNTGEKQIYPPLPFPKRLQKKKLDKQFEKFLEVFKKLHINIPFAEDLEQMPSYAKFMKGILSRKVKLDDLETFALTEECSVVLQQKLPPKLKDPGSFIIPCTIGKVSFNRCLCDLGASINMMPLSIFKQLDLPDPKPTYITLQLTNRSITYPRGIVEDVLVKVEKLIFPADFVILDFEEDKKILITLGRPFLATGQTLIDVQKGELTMRVLDQDVTFNVFNAMKFPTENEECLKVELVDSVVTSELDQLLRSDALEKALLGNSDSEDDEGEEQLQYLNTSPWKRNIDMPFESLGMEELKKAHKRLKPSIEEAPTLELKPLLEHLSDEEKLMRILREFKSAIVWTIADIKGINPSYCMHKILLEEGSKPTVEQQRRLNPIMKEVVKTEILKWLDAGIIYPISDGSWVSPVQCVPKKGGITVVANKKNELIPTRTVTGWRVCMDYRKLNKATRKDHFPLPFIDQMLDRLAGHEYYYLLEGYSGYNQICIAPEDQEKTTFTCPFGTFAFKQVSFGLCGTPAIF
ncbi:hypothetical protein AgCh_004972 [Apium graveolens]